MGVIIGFILMVAYFYDFKPTFDRWQVLYSSVNQSEHALRKMRQSIAQYKIKPSQTQALSKSDLTRLDALNAEAHKQGLEVQTVHLNAAKHLDATDEWQFHMVFTGQFNALTRFLLSLDQSPAAAVVRDFMFQRNEKGQLTLGMDVILGGAHSSPAMVTNSTLLNEWRDPFCSAGGQTRLQADTDARLRMSVPLDRIQMMGYMHRGSREQGLISLPGHIVLAVEEGFIIGKEQGVIQSIQRDRIVIRLSDGQETLIKMF